jgi:hypothetical protein|tara:strand:- start:5 stop:406 length:402 start_codon:yes stop_codon:yes gene_type:complete
MTIVKALISILHSILPLLFAVVILFSYNIFALGITGIMLFLTIISNYILGDCAITLIEDKYSNNESNDSMIDFMANNTINLFGDKYSKDNRSLVTLEMLWICLLLVMLKILVIYLLIALRRNSAVKKFICVKN